MRAIVTPEEMYRLEQKAIEENIVSIDAMMDLVGKGTVEAIQPFLHNSSDHVLLLIGKGNNGADGLTTGAMLLQEGIPTTACLIEPLPKNSEAAIMRRYSAFLELGGKECSLDTLSYLLLEEPPSIIIDGIYGIGMGNSKAPSQSARLAIQLVNQSKIPIISIDIPSGLDPYSGKVVVEAIHATITIACQFPKRGYFFGEGKNHTGKIVSLDLQIPPPISSTFFMLEEEDYRVRLPKYQVTQNKFSRGSGLLVGGSKGMMGAVSLTAQAAISSGIGYLKTAIRQDSWSEIGTIPLESVKVEIPQEKEALHLFCTKELSKIDALLIGPGLGRDVVSKNIFKTIWKHPQRIPTVLDADALFHLSSEEILPNSVNHIILTPHLAEACRLCGIEEKKQPIHPEELLSLLYEKFLLKSPGCVLLLKGAPTFILSSKNDSMHCYVMTQGDPGMATAGSGDVLTGIIGALISQKLSLLDAAILGSGIHALSGEYSAEKYSSYSLSASHILESIPDVFIHFLK